MQWMIFAAASAFTFALVSVFDKLIISRHVANAKVFIVTVGVAQIILGLALIPAAISSQFTGTATAVAILTGIFSGVYLVIMFLVMESQEVSRVVPVVSTYPIFVAILAYFFLGEDVNTIAWVCIVVTVVGAALVSLGPVGKDRDDSRGTLKAMLFLFLASMLWGLSQFMSKTISGDMSLWGQFVLRAFGGGIVCASMIFIPGVARGVTNLVRRPASISYIFMTEVMLVFFAIFFFFRAIYSGDVYLTSTVMAARPLFVFALTLVLSIPLVKLYNESLDRRALTTRALGTVLTVGGVAGVSLT